MPISIRPATLADLAFIDALQKKTSKMVGWMPTAQLEGKINAGQVLVAEATVGSGPSAVGSACSETHSLLPTARRPLPTPLGYVIGQDQYFKRDDVGIIYALNVVPGHQRSLIGATLLKAMFERSAYGCRLYCCWCAQDIAANHFWEAMGFVPLAFRAGGRGSGVGGRKNPATTADCRPTTADPRPATADPRPATSAARVHIFWQKRIRAGDESTPYWFPSQTTGGSIREDRLVFPIPPGTHWSDAKPIVLPGLEREAPKRLTGERPRQKREAKQEGRKRNLIGMGGLRLMVGVAGPNAPTPEPQKRKPQPKEKVKNDPRLVAAARELRDRWLEKVNAGSAGTGRILAAAKYDLTRALDAHVPCVKALLTAA